jgi:hypothetical protein
MPFVQKRANLGELALFRRLVANYLSLWQRDFIDGLAEHRFG